MSVVTSPGVTFVLNCVSPQKVGKAALGRHAQVWKPQAQTTTTTVQVTQTARPTVVG